MGLGIMRSIRNVTLSRVQRACPRSRSTSLGLSGCFPLFVTPSLKSENPYYFMVNLLLFSEASIVFSEARFLCFLVWWFESRNRSPGWHNQRGVTGGTKPHSGPEGSPAGPSRPAAELAFHSSPTRRNPSRGAAVLNLPFSCSLGAAVERRGSGWFYCHRVLGKTDEQGAGEACSKLCNK